MKEKIIRKVEEIKEGLVEFSTVAFGLIVLSKLFGRIIGLVALALILSLTIHIG